MISQAEVISILQDAIGTTLKAAAPMLLVALVIGLIVSVFQATTQINEQTLSFVPKIIGILLAILIFGGWILGSMTDFTVRLYESILLYLS
ncbi:flagellar biosynthesis protein FliQ [Papillibacter cinnamivorans]|uniref:Flagellar biosynthetic protein FliQ n=1 Tax=Papillibacter cinnamivorans DSM 12816 TaxID=1122930 RepID=A0A1W1YGX7_9FIRM|nr:flagellar biosynthesis protein FliQ [Papillibacter cinnamivorans]SMC35409.1 flagellar biosynthetic protein FliQ [Papillibacter cinnamivorans DSM 12816]